MSEKSELEYLLEAADTTVNAVQLRAVVRRAIERRKQDREKVKHEVGCKMFPDPYDERDPVGPCTCKPHPADNTPKDEVERYMTARPSSMVDASLFPGYRDRAVYVLAADYDALLAERDAARAQILELHEKVAFLESREVCAAAHDNVETCGYCQRDAARAELREAAGLLRRVDSYVYPPEKDPDPEYQEEADIARDVHAFLDRVGKQP